jgi:hypothetical protein
VGRPFFIAHRHQTNSDPCLGGRFIIERLLSESEGYKMEEFTAKDLKIFEDMKQCVQDMGLTVLEEHKGDDNLTGISLFEYHGYNMAIFFTFTPLQNVAYVFIRYADMPAEKILVLYDLLNRINNHLVLTHFAVDPEMRILSLRTGLYVTGDSLDKAAFKLALNNILGSGYTFITVIAKVFDADRMPKDIMDDFYVSMDQIPSGFLWPDGKLREAKMTEEFPFAVHVCADMPAFATHTHGLTELGMPEFLMDHLCIGPKGNTNIINLSYKYFDKAEKLHAIKNGQTVRLIFADLKPEAITEDILDPDRVYCYRRVYPDFEMVKHAYNIDEKKGQSDVAANAWFVQIYVEGDDFALTDEYYKGGIKW